MEKILCLCAVLLTAACQSAPPVAVFTPQGLAAPAAPAGSYGALPAGLDLRVLRAGSGAYPTLQDEVEIRFRSYDGRGELNEGTFNGVPVILPVAEMFPGLQQGLLHMQAGGSYELFIPAHLGYREEGRAHPQASTYHIEVLRIVR